MKVGCYKNMTDNILTLQGVVTQGYQVASGLSEENPFPKGTIEMQLLHFAELGLDLRRKIPNLYLGTINVSIAPEQLKVTRPDYRFEQVNWTDQIDPENFFFVEATQVFKGQEYKGFIYYPDPSTKPKVHQHDFSKLEFLGPWIEGINYGDGVELIIRKSTLKFI